MISALGCSFTIGSFERLVAIELKLGDFSIGRKKPPDLELYLRWLRTMRSATVTENASEPL